MADSYYLFSKESPGAQKIKKQNLFGRQNVTVQTLVNPFGIKFEIVTAEKARCESIGTVSEQITYFVNFRFFCKVIQKHYMVVGSKPPGSSF